MAAKELTIKPGCEAVITDKAAHGALVIEGHGKFGAFDCETPTLIRYGELTADEFFVSRDAAVRGVRIRNESKYEDLVILKHFGPDCGILQMKDIQK